MPEVVYDDARKNDLRDVAAKRGRATVLVAELDGRVVGTVSIFKPGAVSSEAWLPNAADLRLLAVEPALHGKGVAKPFLLDRAEAIARDEWRASTRSAFTCVRAPSASPAFIRAAASGATFPATSRSRPSRWKRTCCATSNLVYIAER